MTNKEAIKFLKEPRMWGWLNVAQQIAIDMAIDALSQQPCEDAISRESTMLRVREFIGNPTYTEKMLVDDMNALPPVTPQPKTGHWVLLDECSNSGYYCSECQKKVVKEGWSGTVKKIKFCPNCGARMIEPQESEDNNGKET